MLARSILGRTAVFSAIICLFTTTPVAAQPQPADQATIDSSIKRGVEFLKSQQKKPTGAWGDGDGAAAVGRTALVGVALIECGVPVTDPGIKKASNLIRQYASELDSTYDLSLAILFLDRLKDQKEKNEKDKRYIQLLAGRLIASQMPSGGWGYKAQKYAEPNILQLVAALKKVSAPPTNPPLDVTSLRAKLPEDMRRLAVWTDGNGRLPADAKDKGQDLYFATTDNSNTHFAMIGLWTARKYGIPVDRTFALVNRRFRTSQGSGGTWAYNFAPAGADGSGAMTCIALLGVAIGHVVAPLPDVKPETDPVIINAFAALQKVVGEPAGDTTNRPKVKDVGGFYFMWSMERIAVLYDLQKLGKKDWYLWGAEILVGNQLGNGSWEEGGFPGESPVVNTAFALLFLKRANLLPDLSKRLLVDPGALAAKVDDKVAPKPPPPTVVQAPVIETAPPPHAVVPKPPPAPAVVATTPAPAPQPEVATPVPAKKTPWLWIVLGMFLVGIAVGWFFFLIAKRRKKKEEDEDEGRKKKKTKKKGMVGAKKSMQSKDEEQTKADEPKKVKPQTAKGAKPAFEVVEDE